MPPKGLAAVRVGVELGGSGPVNWVTKHRGPGCSRILYFKKPLGSWRISCEQRAQGLGVGAVGP